MTILRFLEICLSGIGAGALVMLLYRLFLRPAKRDFMPLVLPVKGGADSVEGRLRWACWQARMGGRYGVLYILDCGMGEETAQICRRFARENDNVVIGDMQALERRIAGEDDCNGEKSVVY